MHLLDKKRIKRLEKENQKNLGLKIILNEVSFYLFLGMELLDPWSPTKLAAKISHVTSIPNWSCKFQKDINPKTDTSDPTYSCRSQQIFVNEFHRKINITKITE